MIALLAALAVSAQPVAARTAAERQHQVETQLLPAVVATGANTPALTLSGEMQALHVPGVAIAVIHNGKVEWIKGYGVARLGGAPVTADTLFQAGSVSKPVAAVAALKLVETGRLALDAPVNSQLKSWKLPDNDFTRKTPVTLRRLLSHTAGTTVHGFAGYAAGDAVPSLTQVLDGARPANSESIRVDQPVGETYRYSGGGYTIVQQTMIDVTGKTFPAILRDTVFAPLRMSRSTYDQPLPAARLGEVALPYDEAGQPIAGGPHTYPEMAAAGLWTTAPDLARFVVEVQNAANGKGRVLSGDMARTMLTPGQGHWGLGFEVEGEGAARSFYHDGSNAGYKATMVGHPASGDGAVVLTNGDQGYQLGLEIVRAIAVAYGWPDFHPVMRQAVALDLAAQRRFVGIFDIKDLGTFEVREADGHLVAEIRKGQVYPLIPASDHGFFMTAQDIVITFDAAADPDHGAIDAGTFHATFQRVSQR